MKGIKMDLNEFLKMITGCGSQCNCPSCRADRGEGKWENIRDMSPSEIEEWQSIRAEQDSIRQMLKSIEQRLKAVDARKTLFWIKADPKDEHDHMKVDLKAGRFKKVVEA
jgi:hypothetical protein